MIMPHTSILTSVLLPFQRSHITTFLHNHDTLPFSNKGFLVMQAQILFHKPNFSCFFAPPSISPHSLLRNVQPLKPHDNGKPLELASFYSAQNMSLKRRRGMSCRSVSIESLVLKSQAKFLHVQGSQLYHSATFCCQCVFSVMRVTLQIGKSVLR